MVPDFVVYPVFGVQSAAPRRPSVPLRLQAPLPASKIHKSTILQHTVCFMMYRHNARKFCII